MRACERCRRAGAKCDASITKLRSCSACTSLKIPCVLPSDHEGNSELEERAKTEDKPQTTENLTVDETIPMTLVASGSPTVSKVSDFEQLKIGPVWKTQHRSSSTSPPREPSASQDDYPLNVSQTSHIASGQIPDEVLNELEFNDRGQESSSWTCEPSSPIEMPLAIDGHPVVIPVEYRYPLLGMFSPPPDPHPLFISSTTPILDEDAHCIFATFPGCLGFYLLVNGMLQVIMPETFNYGAGLPSLPSEFGGLRVSLTPESVCPTVGEASSASSAPTPTTTRLKRMFGKGTAQSSKSTAYTKINGQRFASPAKGTRVIPGWAIRATFPGSKSKERFEGKIGISVAPRDDSSNRYVTVPTHLLTGAFTSSRVTGLDSEDGQEDVKVLIASSSAEASCRCHMSLLARQRLNVMPGLFPHAVG